MKFTRVLSVILCLVIMIPCFAFSSFAASVDDCTFIKGTYAPGEYGYGYLILVSCKKSASGELYIPSRLSSFEGDGIAEIAPHAFYGCSLLEKIEISSASTIGTAAFENCTSLKELVLPSYVYELGDNFVEGCTSLEKIICGGRGSSSYCSDESGVLYYSKFKEIYRFPQAHAAQDYTLPDTVSMIHYDAFGDCKNLKSLTIHGGVKTIPSYAFYGASALETITLPGSLTTIESNNFTAMPNFETVYFEGTQKEWDNVSIGSGNESLLNANVVCTGHNFGEYILDEDGLTETATCTCGKTDTRDACHNWGEGVYNNDATCTRDGTMTMHCTDEGCEMTVTVNDPDHPAKGHSYIETVTESTCQSNGVAVYTCKDCGDSYQETLQKKEHSFTSEIVAPTCTEQGYTMFKCSSCSYSYKGKITKALSHNYVETVTAPTCTEQGFTTHTCSRCGDSYADSYLDPTGHMPGEWETVKEPTTVSEGEKIQCCSVCGETLKSEKIEMLPAYVRSVGVDDIELNYKQSEFLTRRIQADKGTEYTVKYSSSNSKVASVNDIGKVTATGRGTAEITCTVTDSYGNVVKDTCTVTVKFTFSQWLIWILAFGFLWY